VYRARKLGRTLAGAALLVAVAALALTIGQRPTEGREIPEDLGGPDRYLAHLSTDKPIYRAGETVYLRTVLLHADTRKPQAQADWARMQIKSPTGSTVKRGSFPLADSAGGAAWEIPEGQAGGEYTVVVDFPGTGHASAERKFDIRAYRAPRLRWDLEFLKKGYGAGETVSAALSVTRAEGGVPAGARVTAVARVDGAEVHRGELTLDAGGRLACSFALPGEIREGVGTLALVIRDGGVVETAAKTIPILLRRIPMAVYPEGGDLVAGLPSRIYLEAVTPWGDPADLEAEIVTEDGRAIAGIRTEHEGRGRTTFIPEAETKYFVRVEKPAGITALHPLPEVREGGVSLRARERTYGPGAPVEVELAATDAGRYRVALAKREKEIASVETELEAGEPETVRLATPEGVSGVLRVTAFRPDGAPAAERLVFARPSGRLTVEVTAKPERAVPGDQVELTVRTVLPNGEPVPAVVGLTVTDDSVLQMIEKRKQAPRLPAMALLEAEVDHLEDAAIYLSDDPGAETAVDLLLGTQGWRRFAFRNPAEFLERHGDKARRVLALKQPVLPPPPSAAVPKGAGLPEGAPEERGAPPDAAVDAPDAAAGDEPPPAEKPARPRRMKRRMDELAEEEDADARLEPMKPRSIAVREYAHALLPGREPGDRQDFTETLYWNAALRTDKTGTAKVTFHLSDSVTSFRAMVDAFTDGGTLGEADLLIESRQPFYLEPKLPLEVTAGDEILLPVAVVNSTSAELDCRLSISAGEGLTVPPRYEGRKSLGGDVRGRLLVPVKVGTTRGKVKLALTGEAGPHSDRVTREVAVVPFGFPIHDSAGGMLDSTKPARLSITVPEDVHMSTVTTSVKVYPTPAANLTEALRALIRAPYG
jgi:hypothetical protein